MKWTLRTFIFLLFIGCESSRTTTESEKINEFFENYFEEQVSRYPTWQTYLGRKSNYGKLDNETEAYAQGRSKIAKKALMKLKTFDFESLEESEKLSYRIFKYDLEKEIEGFKWRYHYYPLNQMFGYQSEVPSFHD